MALTQHSRIVSLLPSATEIVCALGCKEFLVGRSHECDFPAGVEELPVLTKPKMNPEGNSAQIHHEVTAILENALSVYEVNAELLRELRPTHIVTQVQCEVCAVSMKDVELAVESGMDVPPEIVPLNPVDLDEVFQDIRRVARSLKLDKTGEEVVDNIAQSMAHISANTKRIEAKPRVACIEWIEPLMSGGNWIPELVDMAGGENLFGEKGKHSPFMTWDELSASDPDILMLFPCGFSLKKVIEETKGLIDKEEWKHLRAVRKGEVYMCDGHQFFNRPGPRLLDSLEMMAEILHPAEFSYGHLGDNYVKLNGVYQ